MLNFITCPLEDGKLGHKERWPIDQSANSGAKLRGIRTSLGPQDSILTKRIMAHQSSNRPVAPENGLHYESLESRYIRMIIEADEISWQHNVFASAAHWTLLAGYLVIPGTFTSLQKSDAIQSGLIENKAGELILSTIQNPPLLVIACVFFFAGLLSMGWLFYKNRTNYIWLISRIFMSVPLFNSRDICWFLTRPTLLNALAGLLTSIISLYTAHGGDWSIMALLTVIASSLSVVISSSLLIIYKFRKLQRLKLEHYQTARSGGHHAARAVG